MWNKPHQSSKRRGARALLAAGAGDGLISRARHGGTEHRAQGTRRKEELPSSRNREVARIRYTYKIVYTNLYYKFVGRHKLIKFKFGIHQYS